MAVGFGYIRDDKPTQVDWGQITRDANESLKGIERDRQGRRDKIAEDQKEFTKMLMERPMGGDTRYQQFMGEYTTLISKSMLDKMNQLKRGDISEQEFTTFRGTVSSGATGMMAGAKAYVEGYDTMAQLAAGDGAALTNWQNEKNQRLFNLEGISSMIDPVTGETTFFVLDEDGEKEVVDMSQFLRRSVNQQKAFDTAKFMEDILDAPVNTFTDELKGAVSGQFLKQVEVKDKDGNVSLKVELDESPIRTQAKAAVQQNSHVFDILMRDKTGYRIQALPTEFYELQTKDERDAYLNKLQTDTSVLYVDNNDSPIVSDAQRQEAEDFIVDEVKSRATKSVTAQEYRKGEQIDAAIGKIQEDIDNIIARTANTKASTNLINERINELKGETDTDLSLNMPAIEEFIRKEIAGPIAAGFERGEGMRLPFTKGWLTDKDNQITKRLNNVLGNFGVKINSDKLLKQQLELTVPKPGGTKGKVEIDIRDLTPEQIIEKVTEAVIYVPDENLEFIYNRFIKGSDDDTTTSNPGLGG